MSSTSTKCSECEVRADECKLLCREIGFHEFDAFDMGEAGHVFKVGWIGISTDFLMDLKGCPAAELPSVEDECGGNGSKSLESLSQ